MNRSDRLLCDLPGRPSADGGDCSRTVLPTQKIIVWTSHGSLTTTETGRCLNSCAICLPRHWSAVFITHHACPKLTELTKRISVRDGKYVGTVGDSYHAHA